MSFAWLGDKESEMFGALEREYVVLDDITVRGPVVKEPVPQDAKEDIIKLINCQQPREAKTLYAAFESKGSKYTVRQKLLSAYALHQRIWRTQEPNNLFFGFVINFSGKPTGFIPGIIIEQYIAVWGEVDTRNKQELQLLATQLNKQLLHDGKRLLPADQADKSATASWTVTYRFFNLNSLDSRLWEAESKPAEILNELLPPVLKEKGRGLASTLQKHQREQEAVIDATYIDSNLIFEAVDALISKVNAEIFSNEDPKVLEEAFKTVLTTEKSMKKLVDQLTVAHNNMPLVLHSLPTPSRSRLSTMFSAKAQQKSEQPHGGIYESQEESYWQSCFSRCFGSK